jgi:hypothetical protein
MFKAFKQIPEPLQKQILYRLGYGITIFVVTLILLFYKMELFSILACIFISIFFFASSFLLFRKAIIGDYVIICGECLGVTQTVIKRQIKMIILRTENNRTLKVMMKQRLKNFNVGLKIKFYVAKNVPVYEKEGIHLLYSYLAFDIKDKTL